MERLTAVVLKLSQITFYLHSMALVLAMVALWLCGLLWWLKLLFTMALLCAALWQHGKQKQLPLQAIVYEQGQWWALIHNHKTVIELVHAQLVLPWLMVLNFRINEAGEKNSGKKQTLVLWPDMASPEDLRRLRVWLRNG
jgi:hypothetical protein